MKADVAAFLDRVVGWAAAREDVRLAMLIGSQARTEPPADVWSDVDLVLGVRAPDRLLDRSNWLNALGEVAITYVEPTPIGGQRERRVLFADGLDVDCTIVLAEDLHLLLAEPDVATALGHGCRVLVDKDGHGSALQAVPAHHTDPVLSDQEEFDTLAAEFWYHAVWAARKLARGELWVATQCCNGHMQRLLVQTWAYQVQLGEGAARRTWYGGRFLEKWADPTMLAAFRDIVSAYDETALRRALAASMDAFAMAAREVAAKRGLIYRDYAEAAARHWAAAALGRQRRGHDLNE
jgi:aminoglycoside 6-adenylyltransferase